jgi:GT2 family glycosyltransferase
VIVIQPDGQPAVTYTAAAPAVSVIVPFRSDGPHLRQCLEHLERQTFRSFDVILVPNAESAFGGDGVRILPSSSVMPNRKRQLAAEMTSAPIVAFIDDDAYPAPEWLAAAMRHFDDPSVVACGGPGVTPPDDSARRRAGGAVFASPLVTAGTRHRYVAETRRDVDALPSCNLLIRREPFLRDVDASSRYWPGEDILACVFATLDGERIVYEPDALVYHHRRPLFAAHLSQVWNYGQFRGHFLRHIDRTRRYAPYGVPALFVLAHAVVLPLALRRSSRVPALTAIGIYVALTAWSAVREGRRARANPALVAAGIYLTHLAYGTGTIVGWFRERTGDGPRGKRPS